MGDGWVERRTGEGERWRTRCSTSCSAQWPSRHAVLAWRQWCVTCGSVECRCPRRRHPRLQCRPDRAADGGAERGPPGRAEAGRRCTETPAAPPDEAAGRHRSSLWGGLDDPRRCRRGRDASAGGLAPARPGRRDPPAPGNSGVVLSHSALRGLYVHERLSVAEVARRFEVGVEAVVGNLDHHRMPRRDRHAPLAPDSLRRLDVGERLGVRAVAAQLGVSADRVPAELTRCGIRIRPPGRPARSAQ